MPHPNRLCAYTELKRNWDIHESKLLSLKSSIDQRAPGKFIFAKKNRDPQRPNRSTLRDWEVEKENRALLEKLLHVPRGPKQWSPRKDFRARHRQQRQQAIEQQNQELGGRLKCSRTNYPLGRYLREREQTEKYISLRSRAERPHLWMKNSPKKYRRSDVQEPAHLRTPKDGDPHSRLREVCFDRCFGERVYRLEGFLTCDKVQVLIRNRNDQGEKHDMAMDLDDGVRIIDGAFGGQFRGLLEAVQYDPHHQQFYIRLP